jgi:hypothetical protein
MATIYIVTFDQSQSTDTLGRVEYRDDITAPTSDVTLDVNVPTERLREAFQFSTLGNDTEEESVRAKWTNRSDRTDDKEIIPYDISSSATISSSYLKYEESSTPGATLDFLQQLSEAVFGSISAADLFSNEDNVTDAYREAIVICGSNIENTPSGDASTQDNYCEHSLGGKAALDVLYGLLNQVKERFDFTSICSYTPISSTFDGVYTNVSSTNSGRGVGATFDIIIINGDLASVRVHTIGHESYDDNENITIASDNIGGNGSITISLDDTFVNVVNGIEKYSPMPIKSGDKLQMVFTIASHPDQTDSSGDLTYVSRTALITLTAADGITDLIAPSS